MDRASDNVTALRDLHEADVDWMIAGTPRYRSGLALPPGGVDEPVVLRIVQGIVRELGAASCRASWMIVCGGEVVGLCGYRRPPANGEVEFGYGIAASRRGRGHATRAVAALVEAARADTRVNVLVAETFVKNLASRLTLERNGFTQTATRNDAQDGEILTWRKALTWQ